MTTQVQNTFQPLSPSKKIVVEAPVNNTGLSDTEIENLKSECHANILNQLKFLDDLSSITDVETLAQVATNIIATGKDELDNIQIDSKEAQAIKQQALTIIDDSLTFLSAAPRLNANEVIMHSSKLQSDSQKNFNALEATVGSFAENEATEEYSNINLLLMSAIVAIGMIQIASITAKLIGLLSNRLNDISTTLGQANQGFTKLQSIYQDALNQLNKKEAEDKKSLSTQISWDTAMQYQGDGWRGDGNGNLILDGDDIPDLFKKFAKPINNGKSYVISQDDLKKAIAYVSQELALVLPSKNNKDNGEYGEFYSTYSEATGNNIENNALISATTNKIKAVSDLINTNANKISLLQSNTQSPARDFEQLLNLFTQVLSKL
ncbi:MAG: hypothetical protein ACK5Z5_09800 [Neisseriaceae bacterium]